MLRALAFLVAMAAGIPTQLPAAVIVIRNDPGGLLSERKREIEGIEARGDRVEIRGRYCSSACTAYLGLPEVCVSARTRFGFHGPASKNPKRKLKAERFEFWSAWMASRYPPKIGAWFMEEARYEPKNKGRWLTGTEIIRHGVPECEKKFPNW